MDREFYMPPVKRVREAGEEEDGAKRVKVDGEVNIDGEEEPLASELVQEGIITPTLEQDIQMEEGGDEDEECKIQFIQRMRFCS